MPLLKDKDEPIYTISIAAKLGKLVPPRQRRWMAAIQKRVGITSDVISAMKGVKVAGLSGKVETQVQGLRSYEMEKSVAFRKMQIATSLLGKFFLTFVRSRLII